MANGAQAGTGSAGANQNGAAPVGPYGTPGEVLNVGGPLTYNAAAPTVSIDFANLFVKTAYDQKIYDVNRVNMIFDQFATVAPSMLTHNGNIKRLSFVDDLADATTPLLENLDIDTQVITGRYMTLSQRMYGNAAKRAVTLVAQSMVPYDPVAARKIALNAAKTQDALARTAFFQSTLTMYNPDDTTITGTVGTLAPTLSNGSAGYLSSDVIFEGVTMLGEANADPFYEDSYVLLTGPRGVQHLFAESGSGGWRDVVMRNEGNSGNSIFRGRIGNYQGVEVVVSRRLTNGQSLLFGAEAFAKTFPGVEGLGAYPQAVVSPVTDTLRIFGGVGWKWMGGYSIFRPQNVIKITHASTARAFAATNNAIGATAYAES